jgi:hypothetical protein
VNYNGVIKFKLLVWASVMERREGHERICLVVARGVWGTCRHPEAPAAGYHNIMTSSSCSVPSTAAYHYAEDISHELCTGISLIRKRQETRTHGRQKHSWQVNIKKGYLLNIGSVDGNWIELKF